MIGRISFLGKFNALDYHMIDELARSSNVKHIDLLDEYILYIQLHNYKHQCF